MPMRSSYGNAMVDYLEERPACRRLFFLSVNAPYVKLNTTWHIVRSVVSAAGVETTRRLARHQDVQAQRRFHNAGRACPHGHIRRTWP